jgi:hypothetical protein
METLTQQFKRTRHGFARFVDREAKSWLAYAAARRDHALATATSVRQSLAPRGLERRALLQAKRALRDLQARLEQRLEMLHAAEPAADDQEAPPSGTSLARKPSARRRAAKSKRALHTAEAS